MNERERAILRGKPITPQTEDEAALKYAIENGGGASLPPVTADDNGDVLTVVEGAWAKAEASGGGDFLVTCDFAFGYGATMTMTASNFSHTCAEIFAAHENGQTVVLRGEEAESGIVIDCPLLSVAEETEDETPVYLCQFKGSYFVPEGNGTDFDIFVVLYGDEPTTFVKVRPHEDTFIFNATDTGTVGQDGEHLLNVNTSANEFIAAVDDGKDIIVCIRLGGARMYADCGLVLPPAQDGGDYEVAGTVIMPTSSPATVNVVRLVLHKSGDDYDTWTTAAYASIGRVVPVSTSADAGKVLTVDSNGTPKWVTPQ